MKKMIRVLTAAIIVTLSFSMSVMAARANTSNRTCYVDGCSNRTNGYLYCSTHKCSKKTCINRKMTGSNYCAAHTCQKGRTSCKNGVSSSNQKCASCQKKSSNSSSNSSSRSSSRSNSSSKSKKSVGSSSSSSSKTRKSWSSSNAYDEGYEAVAEDEDYDWDRYYSDSDYASGVDDAMDDYDW